MHNFMFHYNGVLATFCTVTAFYYESMYLLTLGLLNGIFAYLAYTR